MMGWKYVQDQNIVSKICTLVLYRKLSPKKFCLKMAILQKKFSHSIFIRRKEISGSMNPQWKALSHKRAKIFSESYLNSQNPNIPSRFFWNSWYTTKKYCERKELWKHDCKLRKDLTPFDKSLGNFWIGYKMHTCDWQLPSAFFFREMKACTTTTFFIYFLVLLLLSD